MGLPTCTIENGKSTTLVFVASFGAIWDFSMQNLEIYVFLNNGKMIWKFMFWKFFSSMHPFFWGGVVRKIGNDRQQQVDIL